MAMQRKIDVIRAHYKAMRLRAKSMAYLGKDAGQPCAPGETAAKTDCIPASGGFVKKRTPHVEFEKGAPQQKEPSFLPLSKMEKLAEEEVGNLSEEEVLALVGAPAGASVSVSGVHKWKPEYADDLPMEAYGVTVSVRHPNYEECKRFLGIDEKGRKFIRNEILILNDDAPAGLGRSIFISQVQNAIAAGFEYIRTHAAGTGSSSMNGYYTWALFGYDESMESLKQHNKEAAFLIKAQFPEARSISDVIKVKEVQFDDEEDKNFVFHKLNAMDRKQGIEPRERSKVSGADWWKVYGSDLYNARFDLRKGSESRQQLANYLNNKRRSKNRAR